MPILESYTVTILNYLTIYSNFALEQECPALS